MSRTRVLAIADRASLISLRLIGALNVLFVISLLVMLAVAAGKARAQTPLHAGQDTRQLPGT